MVTQNTTDTASAGQNSGETLVIFRKWSNGDIVALFPLKPECRQGYLCSCYEHVGQHGACDPLITRDTKAATPEEYASLARELRLIGYVLRIGKRVPRNAMDVRRVKLRAMR